MLHKGCHQLAYCRNLKLLYCSNTSKSPDCCNLEFLFAQQRTEPPKCATQQPRPKEPNAGNIIKKNLPYERFQYRFCLLTCLCYCHFFIQIHILYRSQYIHAFFHRSLKSFAAGDEAHATCSFIDYGSSNGFSHIAGARGCAT